MKEAVDITFRILRLTEEIRDIWRNTAPSHNLNTQQKQTLKELINKIKEEITSLELLLFS
jgi:hypothetical protein